jgi:Tfp pilus assembly protein PilZ
MHTGTHPHRDQAQRAAGPVFIRNRRRHARVDARGVASHLHARDASAPGLVVENVSMGGIFVRSATALEVGTPVMLQLVRPGLKRAIDLTGHVASVVSPAEAGVRNLCAGMGIRLDAGDPETQRRLRALIDDLGAVAGAAEPPAAPAVDDAAPLPDPTRAELAQARAMNAAQARRIAHLEAELGALRKEMLRRNRTVGDLANRLAAFEQIRAAG